MSERTKFCVHFCANKASGPTKTCLLSCDSTKDQIYDLWKKIYDEETSAEIEIVVAERFSFSLNDKEDFETFKTMAEDQYRLHPDKPLAVMLCKPGEYRTSHPFCTPSPENQDSSPGQDVDGGTKRLDGNVNSVDGMNGFAKDSEENSVTSTAFLPDSSSTIEHTAVDVDSSKSHSNEIANNSFGELNGNSASRNVDKSANGAESTSSSSKQAGNATLPSLEKERERYYQGQEGLAVTHVPSTQEPPRQGAYVEGFAPLVSSLAYMKQRTMAQIKDTPNWDLDRGRLQFPLPGSGYLFQGSPNAQGDFFRPVVESLSRSDYEKQLLSVQNDPSFWQAIAAQQEKRRDVAAKAAGFDCVSRDGLQNEAIDFSRARGKEKTYSRDPSPTTAGASSSSSYFHQGSAFQTGDFFPVTSNSFVGDMRKQRLCQYSPSAPAIIPITERLEVNAENLASRATPITSHFVPTSYLSHCFPVGSFSPSNPNRVSSPIPHAKRKKQLVKSTANQERSPDSQVPSKRKRSSPNQSNIEYHYEQAVKYSQLTKEEQDKLDVKAPHKSHWKHLLFVVNQDPTFLEVHRHSKYDEWSSDARDIFALCNPHEYHWSFLTLSKQGDVLCRRIKKRIEDLLNLCREERPKWFPESDDVLRQAYSKAHERLLQLEKIADSKKRERAAKKEQHESGKPPSSLQSEKWNVFKDKPSPKHGNQPSDIEFSRGKTHSGDPGHERLNLMYPFTQAQCEEMQRYMMQHLLRTRINVGAAAQKTKIDTGSDDTAETQHNTVVASPTEDHERLMEMWKKYSSFQSAMSKSESQLDQPNNMFHLQRSFMDEARKVIEEQLRLQRTTPQKEVIMVKNEPIHQSAEEEKVEHREFEQSHLVENETPFKVPQVPEKFPVPAALSISAAEDNGP